MLIYEDETIFLNTQTINTFKRKKNDWIRETVEISIIVSRM